MINKGLERMVGMMQTGIMLLCHIIRRFYCEMLMLSVLGILFSRQHIEIFFFFFFSLQKTGFDISCKLSPKETVCMKCQSLFSGENMKNIVNLLSAELAQRAKVKDFHN